MLSWLTQSWCLQQHTKLQFRWETFFRIFLGLITQRHFSLEMQCGPWGHEFPWTRFIQVLLKIVFKPEHSGESYYNTLRSVIWVEDLPWTQRQNSYWARRLSSKGNLKGSIMLSKVREQSCPLNFSSLQFCLRASLITSWQHSHSA